MAQSIRVKRAYEAADSDDGKRVLVDRLWPRGITKKDLNIDAWIKDIAPSNELRKWYDHDPAKWVEFRKRYFKELESYPDLIAQLRTMAGKDRLTLVYSAKNTIINNAVALKEYLEKMHR